MFCPGCGAHASESANFCEKCGGSLTTADAHPAVSAAAHSSTTAPASVPRAHLQLPKNPLSIAQMMTAFCALLIFVIPATGFYQEFVRGVNDTYGIVGIGQIAQLLDSSDSGNSSDIGRQYLELFALRIALASPLLILSIYTGILLWNKRPGALELSKKFLIAIVAFLICSHLIFPHFFGLSEKYDGTLSAEFWLSVLFLAICYYGLRVSKQVKDTVP